MRDADDAWNEGLEAASNFDGADIGEGYVAVDFNLFRMERLVDFECQIDGLSARRIVRRFQPHDFPASAVAFRTFPSTLGSLDAPGGPAQVAFALNPPLMVGHRAALDGGELFFQDFHRPDERGSHPVGDCLCLRLDLRLSFPDEGRLLIREDRPDVPRRHPIFLGCPLHPCLLGNLGRRRRVHEFGEDRLGNVRRREELLFGHAYYGTNSASSMLTIWLAAGFS